MTLKEFRDYLYQTLSSLYDDDEIVGIYTRLLKHLFGMSRAEAALQPTLNLNENQIAFALDAIARLAHFEPVQYVLGYTDFCDLRLEVTPSVLIPRPETEELVAWIAENHLIHPPKKILDIGTGSGCIALVLKKIWPKAQVTGLDLSEQALECARENARETGLEINFIQGDVFNWKQNQKYDLIVSNPPYVKWEEKRWMRENVLNYEPHLALFVTDENPLIFYERIVQLAKKQLHKGGYLYFEINEKYGEAICKLFKINKFQSVEMRCDMYGKQRFVSAVLMSSF